MIVQVERGYRAPFGELRAGFTSLTGRLWGVFRLSASPLTAAQGVQGAAPPDGGHGGCPPITPLDLRAKQTRPVGRRRRSPIEAPSRGTRFLAEPVLSEVEGLGMTTR